MADGAHTSQFLPAAIADLERSGIAPAPAEAAGMFSVEDASTIYPEFLKLPALVIPYFDTRGEQVYFERDGERLPFCRVRYLAAPPQKRGFIKPGKPQRYAQPTGSPVFAYFPRVRGLDWAAIARDPSKVRTACEGEKKALKTCLDGFTCIGLGGVANFTRKDLGLADSKTFLPELDAFEWRGCNVLIAFDSDASENADIQAAEYRLARELGLERGAKVYRARLKPAADGSKAGIDDLLVAGGPDALEAIAAEAEEMREADARIGELNEEYAVMCTGGKTVIARFSYDEAQRRHKVEFLQRHDFETALANRFTQSPDTGKPAPLAKVWLAHPGRRQYLNGVSLEPMRDVPEGTLNLWRGFSVEPAPGDWSRLRSHIVENVCSGNLVWSDYFLNWMARLVQQPGEPGEVAIVLRGNRGVGKGKVATWIGRLMRDHFFHAIQNDDVTGRFNSHLLHCVFLFADEAFFAGDPRNEKTLNGLITEKTRRSEQKFMPLISVPNYLHLMMATNSEWAIPAGEFERRYFVLDVGDAHMQDTRYFAAIDHQMEAGGLAAMLYDLQRRDISKFEVRHVPQTKALMQQKLYTMHARGGTLAWLQDVLTVGEIKLVGESKITVAWGDKELLLSRGETYDAYVSWERNKPGRSYPDSRIAFGQHLKRVLRGAFRGGDNDEVRLPKAVSSNRPRAYRFAGLAECRTTFADAQSMPGMWEAEK